MGYDTYWSGELAISPLLSDADKADLAYLLSGDEVPKDVFRQVGDDLRGLRAAVMATKGGGLGYTVFEFRDDHLAPPDFSAHSYHEQEVLPKLLRLFFAKRKYSVSGAVTWSGEDSDDRGCLHVKENRAEFVFDVIRNPGPSWGRRKRRKRSP